MRPSSLPRARAFSAALGLFIIHAAAASPNLVVNGDFDGDVQLQGWQPFGSATDSLWQAEDVDLDPASGSAWVSNAQSAAGHQPVLRQCIVLDPPSHAYVTGASLGVEPGTVAGGAVFVEFHFRQDAACGDAIYAGGGLSTTWSGWSPLTMKFGPGDLWFVPGSLEVRLGASRSTSGEGPVSGHIDAVFAYADGVMRNGFDGREEPSAR